MLRMLGGLGNEAIKVPIGHRWVQGESQIKDFIAFDCEHCRATFALSLNQNGSWTGSFQYFEDSCVEAEAIMAGLPEKKE